MTGPEKDCGKTSYLNRALTLVRRALACRTGAPGTAGVPARGPAFFSIGYDGDARDSLLGARKPPVPVAPGDVVVSAERFLRSSGINPEILETVPGSTAFGRLAVARAHRPGFITLVGPEGNENVARALEFITGEGIADTLLVDGAIDRITQVASWPGARFTYVLRVGRDNFERSVRRMRLVCKLALLRRLEGSERDGAFMLAGPLTEETVHLVPPEARVVAVGDFTKVFLDDRAFSSFAGGGREIRVLAAPEFSGFVVALRGISRGRFMEALGDPGMDGFIEFNPYEERGGR
ncbi:MAG: hypothetical protein NT080_02730 [Spirochaetes bacterium]|nr:hypothetical protein [Spirochaetota bacterium]